MNPEQLEKLRRRFYEDPPAPRERGTHDYDPVADGLRQARYWQDMATVHAEKSNLHREQVKVVEAARDEAIQFAEQATTRAVELVVEARAERDEAIDRAALTKKQLIDTSRRLVEQGDQLFEQNKRIAALRERLARAATDGWVVLSITDVLDVLDGGS